MMLQGNFTNHPIGPHYCDGCFLECTKRRKSNRSGWYPCRPEVREWAREHRDDQGDEDGYVYEER